jgi:hypothetical protein
VLELRLSRLLARFDALNLSLVSLKLRAKYVAIEDPMTLWLLVTRPKKSFHSAIFYQERYGGGTGRE